jgi:hypothetical protein
VTPDDLAAKTAAIKAEWEAKAAAGDAKAKRLLRECYPEETEAVDAAADALTHWSEGSENP